MPPATKCHADAQATSLKVTSAWHYSSRLLATPYCLTCCALRIDRCNQCSVVDSCQGSTSQHLKAIVLEVVAWFCLSHPSMKPHPASYSLPSGSSASVHHAQVKSYPKPSASRTLCPLATSVPPWCACCAMLWASSHGLSASYWIGCLAMNTRYCHKLCLFVLCATPTLAGRAVVVANNAMPVSGLLIRYTLSHSMHCSSLQFEMMSRQS